MKNSTWWNHRFFFTCLLLFCVTKITFSQPGSNDPSFNPGDLALGAGTNGLVYCSAIQNDGKIIIGGTFNTYNSSSAANLARLNTDGAGDYSFNTGTGANNSINALAIQADGKILIGGLFTVFNGISRSRIARLNTDGSLDNSFNPGTGANNSINSLVIQADGKILIGGQFTIFNGFSRTRIARLNTDGSVDNGFNPGSGANSLVAAMAVQPDGSIVIGGQFTTFSGLSRNRIARLSSTGVLENLTFNTGNTNGANSEIYALALQADGRIVIGGLFTSYNGAGRNYIARLNTNGTLDNAFNPGTGANNWVGSVDIRPNGKIVIAGLFSSYNGISRNYIAQLNTDGSLDNSLNSSTGVNNIIYTQAFQTDGKIVIGGIFISFNGTSRNNIARLNADGSLDDSFNPKTGSDNAVNALSMQPDGKIVTGGQFTSINGTSRNRIARLNADGTLDNTFNPGTGANSNVTSIAIQPDGKIIIGGDFTACNGTAINRIARLNADGTLDNTLSPGTGPNNTVNSVVMQPDGKIVIGGLFTTYDGASINRIARLNADGTLDNTFNPGTGPNNTVYAVVMQPDGKIVIGGSFTTYDGASINYIARLNADGTLDNTLNPGTGPNNAVYAVVMQPDGKIVIGGIFLSYNGISGSRITRLNADGTLDNTFNPGTGANNRVNNLAVQPDGRILMGGLFTTYNGSSSNFIARMNADGTRDNTFNTGSGASTTVNALSIQSDGRILIGGVFIAYNSVPRNRIARILNCAGQALATANKLQTMYITGVTSFLDNCQDLITTITPGGATPVYGSTIAKVWMENAQPQQYVKRHFELIPSTNAATSTGTVTLYFTQAEFDAFNAVNTLKLPAGPGDAAGIANLRIEKRSGSSSDGSGLPDTYSGSIITIDPADASIVWNATASRWEISFSVTGYGGFFAKTSNFILPVKWISFHARLTTSQHAELEWEADEYNVSGYVVERSEDGRNFTVVATLDARGNGVHSYVWTDPLALQENNYYYRIRQTDLDGSFSYSQVIVLSLSMATRSLQVYPNPLKDGITVISRQQQTAILTDISGKMLKHIILVQGTNYISIPGLKNGIYVLKTQNNESVKLVKE